jgi:hypothetical protein
MKNTMRTGARLPFRMPRAAVFGRRSGQVMLVLAAVLVLQACDGKESSFFAPAIGINIPTPTEIDGTWEVDYAVFSTDCEATLDDFTETAEMSTFSDGTVTLDVLVGESVVPIRGTYVVETGVFTGETGPVSVGNSEFSNEVWDVRFLTDSRGNQTFSGAAIEEISSGGAQVCERQFEISGSKLVAVPT